MSQVNRRNIRGYERSEGEVGAPLSEIHSDIARFPSNPRSVGLGDRAGGALNQQNRSITPVIQRPTRNHELGQTYEYENAIRDSNEVDKPVYDSSDGPVPKGGRAQGGGRGKADVFVSGESFGGQKDFR